ncbi:YraN family protein [Microbacterium sp. NPDC057407]|uniref:YraN family protein n=1 Tax=Microbacterium sp. NPDC057407 TaxID=3346120 RepID=UPI00366BC699
MAAKDDLGRAGEERAATYFRDQGYAILSRNWRCDGGEIDLVVGSADDIAIVEVKTRRSEAFGHPFEAVDSRKRTRLWRLAVAWAAAHRDAVQGRRLRVDAVALTGSDPRTARLEHIVDVEVP